MPNPQPEGTTGIPLGIETLEELNRRISQWTLSIEQRIRTLEQIAQDHEARITALEP